MRRKEIHIYLYVLYIYSVIIMMGCDVVAQLSGGSGSSLPAKARYKTMYACEDRQLVMDCDPGNKINLIRANYGRFSIMQCNEQGQLEMSTECMSPITFRIMRDRCQDKSKCSVNATSSLFGDKCPNTRKYLEVHFQCQPDPQFPQSTQNASSSQPASDTDRVNVRLTGNIVTPSPSLINFPPYSSSASNGQSPILPPNNPINGVPPSPPLPPAHLQPPKQEPGYIAEPGYMVPSPNWETPQQQQLVTSVMNSDILTYKVDSSSRYPINEPLTATFRHIHLENISNPRCVFWDPNQNKWILKGATVIFTNATHTTCALDQTGSYMLVMDMPSPQVNYPREQHPTTFPTISLPSVTKTPVPPFGPPVPDLFNNQPEPIPSESTTNQAINTPNIKTQQQALSESPVIRFFSLFGYLFAFVIIAVALGTLAFIASTMRSSAGAALKSLGNFAAFSSAKYKNGRRSDHSGSGGPLHNKDLLVINNQNGHQFLYAPASTTKINSSASTHILSTGSQVGTLHQFNQQQLSAHQQQMYSANGTLSNLSGTGGQSNNYYYGLMGLTPLFQQQSQMQHHVSQHHINNQQQQQASYLHQANKSTVSNESSHSTPSSSGVESGSTSVHHHQQQQQPAQQQQACLMMNSDYNLMSHQLTNYGQLPLQQPTLTYNAHYGMTPNNNNQRQLASLTGNSMREHIYECVDDDKPYTARLLLPTNLNTQADQFNSSTLNHHIHHQQQQQQQQQQQINQSRALTLSSRLAQNQANQQQQQQNNVNNNNNNNKRLLSHPAIIRDNQAKTNIICSKLVQVTPQRATEISNKFQHDVMAIYNPNDTTTTTANSSTSGNSSSCYSRAESVSGLNGKLSTDC